MNKKIQYKNIIKVLLLSHDPHVFIMYCTCMYVSEKIRAIIYTALLFYFTRIFLHLFFFFVKFLFWNFLFFWHLKTTINNCIKDLVSKNFFGANNVKSTTNVLHRITTYLSTFGKVFTKNIDQLPSPFIIS